MQMKLLEKAVYEIKKELESAIQNGKCLGKSYSDGQKAKEALIRSQRLIMKLHEVTKVSLSNALKQLTIDHEIYPPLGKTSPELKITGFIKAKQQDVVILVGNNKRKREKVVNGPLLGMLDTVGREASERAIVVGVRSQMSSVAKNFDTLMERAFAETLNLRLRLQKLVMGEVYLLPVVEYDDIAMVRNSVKFKSQFVPVMKFIKTFNAISGRSNGDLDKSLYKYDRSCLILIDCRGEVPIIFKTLDDLKKAGVVPNSFEADFLKLSPLNFCKDLLQAYCERHQ